MDLPKRKQIRLPAYDYSAPGAYFITICTKDRRRILSDIAVGEGLAPPAVTLSAVGSCVENEIRAIPSRYPTVTIDRYVIMPNHVRLIVSLHEDSGGASPSPTVFDVVRVIKSISAHLCKSRLGGKPLWQRSYHEHVIRGEEDYRQIWEYIDANPAGWAEDRYYTE